MKGGQLFWELLTPENQGELSLTWGEKWGSMAMIWQLAKGLLWSLLGLLKEDFSHGARRVFCNSFLLEFEGGTNETFSLYFFLLRLTFSFYFCNF